jgi:hypothetical protein
MVSFTDMRGGLPQALQTGQAKKSPVKLDRLEHEIGKMLENLRALRRGVREPAPGGRDSC